MSKFRNYSNYEIYPDGKIWSCKYKKFLKPNTIKGGYKRVCLTDNEGNIKFYLLHRVVYEAITGEPIPPGMEINHIDERKDNNIVSNLELVTHKQNVNFGTRNERASKSISKALTNNKKLSKSLTNNPKRSKAVGAFKGGKLVITFPSTNEASRNGFDQSAVAKCCNGKIKSHKGYEWRYL